MDAPIIPDEEITMYDMLISEQNDDPETGLLLDSLRFDIERVITTLPVREAEIIRFFYGLSGKPICTLDEIASKFDLTRERVRQIKDRSIRRLKQSSRTKNLKYYLG